MLPELKEWVSLTVRSLIFTTNQPIKYRKIFTAFANQMLKEFNLSRSYHPSFNPESLLQERTNLMNALRQNYIDQPKMQLPLPPFYSDQNAG